MTNEELTIEALQNRVAYLEAHLHLALQVLQQMEQDFYHLSDARGEAQLEIMPTHHTVEVTPISKIELPTFLSSRTWKQSYQSSYQPSQQQNHRIRNVS